MIIRTRACALLRHTPGTSQLPGALNLPGNIARKIKIHILTQLIGMIRPSVPPEIICRYNGNIFKESLWGKEYADRLGWIRVERKLYSTVLPAANSLLQDAFLTRKVCIGILCRLHTS